MIKIEDIKGSVVAHRNDRMGARIIAMLNALRVAKDYDLSFTCGWTTGGRTSEEVRDPTNIFTKDYVDAFFFDNDILGRVYDDLIDLSTIQNAPGDPSESDFRQRALKGSAYLCGAAMGVTVLPWENEAEVAARLPRGLEHMQFSPPVAETIQQIEETQGNWATAMARLQAAIWFRPLEPMVHGALNLGLTAGVVNPRDFYPFDTNLIREKGAVFPPGKKALGQLNAFASRGHDPDDRSAFHPWDLVVRDWRLSMGKRLNRAYTNKSKIQKTRDMLERSFAKTHAGTPALASALAVLDRGMGRLDEALEQQRQVVAQEPDVAIYRKRLSDVLYQKGNDKMGLFQLEKGYELSEGHPCFAAELGWRWWKIKEKREDCIRLFVDLAATDHGFVELHFMTADMLRRKEAHIELALEQIDKGIAQGHGHQRMMTTKARILMLLGRAEEAQALYENIVDWGQGTEHTHVEIYRQFKALGQVDTAKALTGRSIYDFDTVREMAGD